MSELLPCPFCGGEAELRDDCEGCYPFYVQCIECGCMTCGHAHSDTPFGAVSAWNTRAQTVFGMTLDEVRQMMKRDAERERTCRDVKPSLPYFKCDSCGMEDMGGTELWIQDGFYRSQKPNYCPNCGAKVVS